MKIEIGREFPDYFQPAYPEEFELFSHLETASAIPQALFAITTWKDNGLPNVCFHAWSCFYGDKAAFFAVLGGLYQHTHTYRNLQKRRGFCLNFLPLSAYDRLVETIHKNGDDTDEFAAGGFSPERARTVDAPYIAESFLVLECSFLEARDLSGAGVNALVTGRVERVPVEESYAAGREKRCGKEGFMLLVPGAQNLLTGEPTQSAIATLKVERLD